jgi:hypothetical protein
MQKYNIKFSVDTNPLNKHLAVELSEKHDAFFTLLRELQDEVHRFGIDKINSEYFKDLIKIALTFRPDEIEFLNKNADFESKKDSLIGKDLFKFIEILNVLFNIHDEDNEWNNNGK